MTAPPQLARRLGVADAVFIGLGSMIGAGVFAAFTPAAQSAGSGLLVGLVVAALIALCNATSSAALSAVYPSSGGTYISGREQLGHWWGFIAGWMFVVGKTASCAAMALTFAAYAAPAELQRPVAIAAVLALAAVNCFGVTRTATLTRIIVVGVLLGLSIIVAAGAATAVAGLPPGDTRPDTLIAGLFASGGYGVLQSAGLLFFAFAGYARIATMGEEVRDPARTIPRAILIALIIAVLIYAVIAVLLLVTLGVAGIAGSPAPLADVVTLSGWRWALPIARITASAASLGALLALIAGIGRTALAMARENDLPGWLAVVHPRFRVPHHAEIALAVLVSTVILVSDLRGAIGFSSFGVLSYYLIANIAAFTLPAGRRRYPRALQVGGAIGCTVLVATLPPQAIATGIAVALVGVLYRSMRQRRARHTSRFPTLY